MINWNFKIINILSIYVIKTHKTFDILIIDKQFEFHKEQKVQSLIKGN